MIVLQGLDTEYDQTLKRKINVEDMKHFVSSGLWRTSVIPFLSMLKKKGVHSAFSKHQNASCG